MASWLLTAKADSSSDPADTATVMRARNIPASEAFRFVQSKRRGIEIDEGYMRQLEVWRACRYEIYEKVKGRKTPKRLYAEWIEREVGERSQSQLDQYCTHA